MQEKPRQPERSAAEEAAAACPAHLDHAQSEQARAGYEFLEAVVASRGFNRFTRFLKWGQIGAAVCLTGLAMVANAQKKSGEFQDIPPMAQVPVAPSSAVRVLDWNVHHVDPSLYSGDIQKIVDEYNVPIVTLQEVTLTQAAQLPAYFPDWHVGIVTADGIQRGGFADIMMTKMPKEDVQTRSFKGTGLFSSITGTALGFGQDTAEAAYETIKSNFLDQAPKSDPLSFSHTANGRQEYRAAVAATLKIPLEGDTTVPIRMITAHIAGYNSQHPDLHQQQFDALLKFAASNVEDNRTTIVCADFNSSPEEVMPPWFSQRFFALPDLDKNQVPEYTSLPEYSHPAGKTIDYCFSTLSKDFPMMGTIKVIDNLPNVESEKNLTKRILDHRPILFTVPQAGTSYSYAPASASVAGASSKPTAAHG